MGATVKRDNGKVWIEGVPSLGWGKDCECTFAGALSAALALRTRWYHGEIGQRWCPSSPVGEFPQEVEAEEMALVETRKAL